MLAFTKLVSASSLAQRHRTQLIRLCALVLAFAFTTLVSASFACSAAGQIFSITRFSGDQTRKELTVERIWGQPSLSGSLKAEVEWSPDGKRLSYLETSGRGKDAKTSLWMIDVASGERRGGVGGGEAEQISPPPPAA